MPLLFLTAAAIFFIELFVKTYLHNNFAFHSLPIIKNIFHITLVENTGAAFGILQGKTNLLIYMGIVFILIFLFIVRREKDKGKLVYFSYGLILGGALSNIYDRIFRGFVIDYIDLRIWPVFNIADSCISIGIIILLWQTYRTRKTRI